MSRKQREHRLSLKESSALFVGAVAALGADFVDFHDQLTRQRPKVARNKNNFVVFDGAWIRHDFIDYKLGNLQPITQRRSIT